MMRVRLTTLDSVKNEIGTEKNTDDADFNRYIDSASDFIVHSLNRNFVPTRETWYGRRDARINPYTLEVDRDLLEIETLYQPTGGTIAASDYQLLPLNASTKYRIELTQEGGQIWNFPSRSGTVTLTGWFGYHDDYARAWRATDALQGTLSASGTVMVVANSAAFQIGDYTRISNNGTIEAMRITGTVAAGSLVVERGELGTSAVGWGSLVTVDRYQHVRQVQQFANRLAVWFYENRDLVQSYYQVADGTVRINSTLEGELAALKNNFDRMRFEVMR